MNKSGRFKMQYKKGFFCVLCITLLAVSGCSSVPKASSSQSHQAKLFTTNPDKANLYIFRGGAEGSSIEMELRLDGQYVATNLGHTFIKLEVPAGKHYIASRADNVTRLTLATAKNKNYFIYQEVKVGQISTTTKLNLVSENVGKKGVNRCDMISSVSVPADLTMR